MAGWPSVWGMYACKAHRQHWHPQAHTWLKVLPLYTPMTDPIISGTIIMLRRCVRTGSGFSPLGASFFTLRSFLMSAKGFLRSQISAEIFAMSRAGGAVRSMRQERRAGCKNPSNCQRMCPAPLQATLKTTASAGMEQLHQLVAAQVQQLVQVHTLHHGTPARLP